MGTGRARVRRGGGASAGEGIRGAREPLREQSDDRFGQGVVVGVAAAAYRRFDAGFGKALGVADRKILSSAVTVVDEILDVSPIIECLLQSIQSQIRPQRARRTPAHNTPREHVDDEAT